jgi:hypothetical protein
MMGRPRNGERLPLSAREGRRWRVALGQVQARIKVLDEERQKAQREVAELRKEIASQARKMEDLAEGVVVLSKREQELRVMLLDAHDQLMRRAEKIKVDLASDLQTITMANNPGPPHRPDGSVPQADQSGNGPDPGSGQGVGHRDYPTLVRHIKEVARTVLPPKATVAVVSKGDDELLRFGDELTGWHFPQNEDGVYAGFYPADSTLAIAHLEELRSRGAGYLLFPETAFWWLDRYEGFAKYLDAGYRRIWAEGCIIYALHQDATEAGEEI